MINKKIIMATGNAKINSVFKEYTGYNVIGSANYSDELDAIVKAKQPEIILATEMLSGDGPLHSTLLKLKSANPTLRIVYIVGSLNLRNPKEVDGLALLILAGICDIVVEPRISIEMIKKAIDNEKTEDDVKHILLASTLTKKVSTRHNNIEFILPREKEDAHKVTNKNLFAISSIKPGTGKSFIAVNLAVAIAQYGVPNKNGEPPRVGIIEADLQNLSLGTLLQVENKEKNIKNAMKKIAEIIDENENLSRDVKKIQEVNEYVKGCFVPFRGNKNLLALVGSQIMFEEFENVNGVHYTYLIESILENFDVVIVDTNSSLTHTTTYPVLKLAQSCYYILNLDFNNARNNARYRDTLIRMGLAEKIRYILNEDITPEMEKMYGEELFFTSAELEKVGFKIDAKIPVIPKPIFLNRLYQGIPIVLDNHKESLSARREILKIANQIYPLKGF